MYEHSAPQNLSDVFAADKIIQLADSYKSVEDQRLVTFFVCNENLKMKFLKDVLKHEDTASNLTDVELDSTYFCFSDPSGYASPGWPLRNYIFMLLTLCPTIIGKQIKVMSIRMDEKLTLSPSLIFTIDLQVASFIEKSDVKWTGWERNNQGKLLPKMSSMGNSMDPVKVRFTI